MRSRSAFHVGAMGCSWVLALATLTGCESKGPAANVGASIDKGVQKAKDTVSPPGPTEKAGRAVDNALNK